MWLGVGVCFVVWWVCFVELNENTVTTAISRSRVSRHVLKDHVPRLSNSLKLLFFFAISLQGPKWELLVHNGCGYRTGPNKVMRFNWIVAMMTEVCTNYMVFTTSFCSLLIRRVNRMLCLSTTANGSFREDEQMFCLFSKWCQVFISGYSLV